jgi:hypothetical protein
MNCHFSVYCFLSTMFICDICSPILFVCNIFICDFSCLILLVCVMSVCYICLSYIVCTIFVCDTCLLNIIYLQVISLWFFGKVLICDIFCVYRPTVCICDTLCLILFSLQYLCVISVRLILFVHKIFVCDICLSKVIFLYIIYLWCLFSNITWLWDIYLY